MFYEPLEAFPIRLSEVSILVNVKYHKIPIGTEGGKPRAQSPGLFSSTWRDARTQSAGMSTALRSMVYVFRSRERMRTFLARVGDRVRRRPKCQTCHRRIRGVLREASDDLLGSLGDFKTADRLRVLSARRRTRICLSQGWSIASRL